MDSLTKIRDLIKDVPKPDQFGHPEHCSECAEHNKTLIPHKPETISMRELGNPGWDPICHVDSIDGFRYYLPALARLSCGVGDEYFLDQFLFHLNAKRISDLCAVERIAIAKFLEDLVSLMPDEIDNNLDKDALLNRILRLREFGGQY